jgi:phosphoglycolate phosphatase
MNGDTKYIVWDWNGTLLDDTSAVLEALNKGLAHIGRDPVDMEKLRTSQTVPLIRLYRNLGLTAEDIERHLLTLREIFHDHYESIVIAANLRECGAALLDHAREHEIAHIILSNHIVPAIEAHMARLKCRGRFARVIAFASREEQHHWTVTKGKRLETFMHERGLRPENGLIVGDTVEEVEIGRQTGLASVAITGGMGHETHLRVARPDHLIQALPEMRPILAERGLTP